MQAVLSLCAAACLSACVVVGDYYALEERFTPSDVSSIALGETTRHDLLARFGAPLAVARHGGTVKIPPPAMLPAGSRDVPAERIYAHFPGISGPKSGHAIYYYRNIALSWSHIEMYYGPVVHQKPTLVAQDLWILLDEVNGKVEELRLITSEWETCGFTSYCRENTGLVMKSKPLISSGGQEYTGDPGGSP